MQNAPSSSSALLSRGLAFRLALVMILATLSYGALLFYGDAHAIARAASQLNADVLWSALGLASVNYALRFVRWVYYLSLIEVRIPLLESLLIFVSGFAMSITPGKVGELLKSLMLRDSHEVTIARSAPIMIAERVTDLTGLLLLGGFGLLGKPMGSYVAAAATLFALGVGVVMSSRQLGEKLIVVVTRRERLARFAPKLRDAHASLYTLLRPSAFVLASVISIVSWGTQGIVLRIVANAFPDVALDAGSAMVAYAAPLLAGALAMIPGGLGLTEASMTGVITRFGGAGATLPVATAVALVVRVVTFWFAIALGFTALAIWQLRRSANTSARSRAR